MKYVESVQCLQQGPDVGQQCEPQQPQDEKDFQSERAESEDRQGRKSRIRLRLRALPQERQSGTRLIEFAFGKPPLFTGEAFCGYCS